MLRAALRRIPSDVNSINELKTTAMNVRVEREQRFRVSAKRVCRRKSKWGYGMVKDDWRKTNIKCTHRFFQFLIFTRSSVAKFHIVDSLILFTFTAWRRETKEFLFIAFLPPSHLFQWATQKKKSRGRVNFNDRIASPLVANSREHWLNNW